MTFKGHKDSKLQFIYSANGDGSKTAKIIKKYTPSPPECQRVAE